MPAEAPLVLMLDDDLSWLRAVRRLLTREGFSVMAFTDANQLLAALSATRPALIVLDYLLPTTNGAAVARSIRAQGDAPVLVLLSSSLSTLSAQERAVFDAVLDKGETTTHVLGRLVELAKPRVKGRSGTRLRAQGTPQLEASRRRRQRN